MKMLQESGGNSCFSGVIQNLTPILLMLTNIYPILDTRGEANIS